MYLRMIGRLKPVMNPPPLHPAVYSIYWERLNFTNDESSFKFFQKQHTSNFHKNSCTIIFLGAELDPYHENCRKWTGLEMNRLHYEYYIRLF